MPNEVQTTEKSNTAEIATRPNMGFGELMAAARAFAKSSIVPTAFRGKPDDAFVALEWGMELGMKPMASLQNIYVVNGRPTLSAQSMAGLIKSRSDYRGLVFDSSPTKAKVTIKRAIIDGTVEIHIGEFTIEQATKAGLTSKDNWKNYAQQMLEARALAFAVRKAFPDVFAGIYVKEEAQDFDNMRDVTPPIDISAIAGSETPKTEPAPVATSAPADSSQADDDSYGDVDAAFGPPSDEVLKELMKDTSPRGMVKYIRVKHDADLSDKVKNIIDPYLASSNATDAQFDNLYHQARDYLTKRGIEE